MFRPGLPFSCQLSEVVDRGDRAQIKDGHIFIMGRVDKAHLDDKRGKMQMESLLMTDS